jgi:hypothetical protein
MIIQESPIQPVIRENHNPKFHVIIRIVHQSKLTINASSGGNFSFLFGNYEISHSRTFPPYIYLWKFSWFYWAFDSVIRVFIRLKWVWDFALLFAFLYTSGAFWLVVRLTMIPFHWWLVKQFWWRLEVLNRKLNKSYYQSGELSQIIICL